MCSFGIWVLLVFTSMVFVNSLHFSLPFIIKCAAKWRVVLKRFENF